MHGSTSKVPSKKSRPYIHISRLRVKKDVVPTQSRGQWQTSPCHKKASPASKSDLRHLHLVSSRQDLMKPAARMESNPSTLYIPSLFSTNVVGSRILAISKRLLYTLYYHF